MEDIISKELLSEVLGYIPFKIQSMQNSGEDVITLILLNEDGTVRSYQNIFELAHKCKEWAYKNGYILNTEMKESHITHNLCYKVSIIPTEYANYSLVSNREVEAVFAACQLILDNKGNKNDK